MRLALSLIILSLSLSGNAQELKSYQLYNSDNEAIGFSEMIEELSTADVILFGELHNNPICHWLQFELTNQLYSKDSNMVLGAEMFETDNQKPLDLFLMDSASCI